MRYTNKFNLPDGLVRAVTNDPYTKNGADYSVSELTSPPQQLALKRKHDDEIEEDISERIWSLVGQSIHTILERAETTAIAERRLEIAVDKHIVSGGMDRYSMKDGTLQDYKVTNVYKITGKDFGDWENQLNCYAEILRQNGYNVKKLEVVAILRDWMQRQALLKKDYPQVQVAVIQIPLWSPNKAQDYIKDRLLLHLAAAKGAEIECTKEERWTNAKGENPRCERYCSVSKWCEQYKKIRSEE